MSVFTDRSIEIANNVVIAIELPFTYVVLEAIGHFQEITCRYLSGKQPDKISLQKYNHDTNSWDNTKVSWDLIELLFTQVRIHYS